MKKTQLISVFVLVLLPTLAFGRDKPLANHDKRGLYARSLEQVLRLDEEDIDLATAALIISERWSDDLQAQRNASGPGNALVHGRRYLTRLDNMARQIRDRLEKKGLRPNYKAIAVINEYLFDELGFAGIENADNPEDLFLHTVMDKKKGYCLSLSILYLSLGERLGLPLYGVVVPSHFFVRYDDGRIRFNIETTGKGGTADEKHYIEKFNVPKHNGIYMTNLDKLQTLGCFFNNLGNSYDKVGNTDRALSALEKAVKLNPLLAESRGNLANVYLKFNRTSDAIYEYRAALEINPNDNTTHNNLANAYVQKGWLNDAISEYNHSLRLNPRFIEAHKNLASAYCQKQMFDAAIAQLNQALALKPKNASLYSRLGSVYIQTHDYEYAQIQYKKALKIKPDLAEAHYGLGLCYNKFGLVDEEIAAYKKALAIEPDMVAALMSLGNIYFDRKNFEAALQQYSKAVHIAGDDGWIHYNLAAAYFNTNRYEQAVAEYQKAIELEPEMADAHHGLALVFYKLKKYDLAAEHITKADELGFEIPEDLLDAIKDKLK